MSVDYKKLRKLQTLERRAAFLIDVTSLDTGSTGTSYDKAELAALRFAIETIRERYNLPVDGPVWSQFLETGFAKRQQGKATKVEL